MGELINLNPAAPIADGDLPPSITRDRELELAIEAHLSATDPHSQYLNFTRGDARYEYRAPIASRSIAGPINIPANTWTSLGTFLAFPFGVQGAPSAILVAINFLFSLSSPWQQACCAALLGPVWWQPATVADPGTRVFLEFHNATGFYIFVRNGRFSADLRTVEVHCDNPISIASTGRIDVSVKRLI